MSLKDVWTEPATVDSPFKKERRLQERNWEPYDATIAQLRDDGRTAKQIQEALAREGFHVGINPLKKRLRRLKPTYRDRAERHLILKTTKQQRDMGARDAPRSYYTAVLDDDLETLSSFEGTYEREKEPVFRSIDAESMNDQEQSLEERISRIIAGTENENLDDFDDPFFTDIFEDEEDEDQIVTEGKEISAAIGLMQKLSIKIADAEEGLPEHSLGPHILASESFERTKYSSKDLLDLVEDLPNWWVPSEGDDEHLEKLLVTIEAFEFLNGIDDSSDKEILRVVIGTIAQGARSKEMKNFKRASERATTWKLGLDRLMTPEMDGFPKIFLAYLYHIAGARLLEIGADYPVLNVEARYFLDRARDIFETCSSLPAWAASHLIECKYQHGLLEGGLSGTTEGWEHLTSRKIRDLERILTELKVVNNRRGALTKARAIRHLALEHSGRYEFDYLGVLEALVRMVPRLVGSEILEKPFLLDLSDTYRQFGMKKEATSALVRICEYGLGSEIEDWLLLRILPDIALYNPDDPTEPITSPLQVANAQSILTYLIKRIWPSTVENPTNFPFLVLLVRLGINFAQQGKLCKALRLFERVFNAQDDTASNFAQDSSLILWTQKLTVCALHERGLPMYAQPMAHDLVRKYFKRYGGRIDDRRVWDAVLVEMLVSSDEGRDLVPEATGESNLMIHPLLTESSMAL